MQLIRYTRSEKGYKAQNYIKEHMEVDIPIPFWAGQADSVGIVLGTSFQKLQPQIHRS